MTAACGRRSLVMRGPIKMAPETRGRTDKGLRLLSRTLEGLSLSSKARLRYDYDWKPTEEAIDICSSSLKVSPDPASLSLLVQRNKTHPVLSSKESDHFPSPSTTEICQRKADLLERKLNASYDETHVSLFCYEEEQQNELRENSVKRRDLFERRSAEFLEKKYQLLEEKRQEATQRDLEDLKSIQENAERWNEEARQRQQKLEESHQLSAARAAKKDHQVEQQRQRVLEEKEREQKAVLQLEKILQSMGSIAHTVQQGLERCTHKAHLSPNVQSLVGEMKQILESASGVVQRCKTARKGAASSGEELNKYYLQIKDLATKSAAAVQEANAKAAAEEEERLQAKMKAEQMKAEQMKREEEEHAKQKLQAADAAAKDAKSSLATELLGSISESSFKEYSRLEKLLADTCKSYEPFVADKSPTAKQYKLGLHKAVTTPINAISDQSPAHLMDKIQRLTKVLSGQPIQIPGKPAPIETSPLGQVYCRELLAKKIVQQGSKQVSSSPESAFPVAAVVIGVWSSFPDVGELILAHLHKACPFLVPFNIPRTEGTSDVEYYTTLGYTCDNEEVEAHDKYLKRMSGLVRLYAAITSSPPPRGMSQHHLHGIKQGWRWLACMLNLQPQADYTATALFNYLDVAGHVLVKNYKKQFWKLLLVLVREYLPKIEQISSSVQSGPVVRLKGFLENCIKNQKFQTPTGFLAPHWWSDHHSY